MSRFYIGNESIKHSFYDGSILLHIMVAMHIIISNWRNDFLCWILVLFRNDNKY